MDRYFFSHRPLLMISFQPQTQSFYSKLTPHRLLSAGHSSSNTNTHKRTGTYSSWDRANRTTVTYMAALAIAVVGLSYAAVPLYRIFCQASGYGGTVSVVDPSNKVEQMEPLRERELTIRWVHVRFFTFAHKLLSFYVCVPGLLTQDIPIYVYYRYYRSFA